MLTRSNAGALLMTVLLAASPASLAQAQNSSPAPPTEAEVRARAQQLIANQHKNDDVFDLYEPSLHGRRLTQSVSNCGSLPVWIN